MLTIQNINLITGISELFFTSGPEEYTAVINYSSTADFEYATPGLTGIKTQTITWTVKSSLPIVGGTFLDGSPWIANNGDINLISVTPESTQYQALYYIGGNKNGPTATYMFDAHNTVINPDVGKNVAVGDTGLFVFENRNKDNVSKKTALNADGIIHPFDGRAGYDGVTHSNVTIGRYYDGSQKWNKISRKLETGDMVVTARSHLEDNALISNPSNPATNALKLRNNDDRKTFIDMYGSLTIINPSYQSVANNRFRPPCNWDPYDRANAPLLQEVDNFDGYTFDFPNYDYDSNTKTWVTKLTNSYSTSSEYLGTNMFHFSPDDTSKIQGSKLARNTSFHEFGAYLAKDEELKFITCLDKSINKNVRDTLRRCLVQRGIDMYGAYRSLAKTLGGNGGHNSFAYSYMPIAYLCTRHDDMFELLNYGHLGNTGNSTYMDKSRLYNSTGQPIRPVHFGLTQQWTRYKKELALNNFWHPVRWNNLEIVGITSGTDPTNGPFQKVWVRPPKNTTPGSLLTEIDTGQTLTYSWKPEDLYNFSQNRTAIARGRWNMVGNHKTLEPNMFIGGYIQNPTRGSTYISRIIANNMSTGFPGETTNVYTPSNGIQVFYTRSNIFLGGETYCNISPIVLEDLDENNNDLFYTPLSHDTVSYVYGHMPYSYASIIHVVTGAIINKAMEDSGITKPQFVKDWSVIAQQITSTKLGRVSHFLRAAASVYNYYSDKSYLSLLRKFVLNDAIGPTFTSLFDVKNRQNFPEDQTNWTWIETESPPTGITIVNRQFGLIQVRGDIGNADADFFTQGSTQSIGELRCRGLTHPQNPNYILYLIHSRSSTLGITYNQYIQNKNFYIWLNGAQKPIKMVKYSETPPTTNQKLWQQRWEFPGGYTYNYYFENFPEFNFPAVTCFFADP